MPTGEEVGDTLTNLQTRLKKFQDQLLRLNVGLQLQANGASASSTGAQQTIQMYVPREKRFEGREGPDRC